MAKRVYGLSNKDRIAVRDGIARAKNNPLGGRGDKRERRVQESLIGFSDGYFIPIQTSLDTIKIVDGLNEDSAICGNISANKLAITPVSSQELIIDADAYIYLVVEGVYTSDVLTSVLTSIEQFEDEQSWESGKEKLLISRVLFTAPVAPATTGTITDFSKESVSSRVDIKRSC